MKSEKYWELHKEIWNQKFDSFDLNICRKITSNPHGPEAKRLEKLVESITNKILMRKNKKFYARKVQKV